MTEYEWATVTAKTTQFSVGEMCGISHLADRDEVVAFAARTGVSLMGLATVLAAFGA